MTAVVEWEGTTRRTLCRCRGGLKYAVQSPGRRVQIKTRPQMVFPRERLYAGGIPAGPEYSSMPSTSDGCTSSMLNPVTITPSTQYCGGQRWCGDAAK